MTGTSKEDSGSGSGKRPEAPAARPDRPVEPSMPAPVPVESVLEPDEPPMAIHLSFWRRRWVQVVLPVVSSVLINGGLLLLALAFYSTVTLVRHVSKDQVIVPEARIIEGVDPGSIPDPGMGDGSGRLATVSLEDADVHFNQQSAQLTRSLQDETDGEGGAQVIGFGPRSAQDGGVRRLRQGGVLESMPFGVPGGAEVLVPKAPLLGVSGNAVRIAYICDGSSSMADRMPALRFELREAIAKLKPVQAFNIIFFQQGDLMALSKGPLLMATDENLEKSLAFLNGVETKPNSDPIAALELAFAQRVQLIFLLSDGEFVDNKKVIERIRELNKDKHATINTIAIVSGGDTQQTERDAQKNSVNDLQLIASENGGTFKRVSMRNLR